MIMIINNHNEYQYKYMNTQKLAISKLVLNIPSFKHYGIHIINSVDFSNCGIRLSKIIIFILHTFFNSKSTGSPAAAMFKQLIGLNKMSTNF